LMADQRAKLAARQPQAAAVNSVVAASVGNSGPGFAAQMVAAQQVAPVYSPPPPMSFPEAPPSLPEFPRTAIQPASSLDYNAQITPNQQIVPMTPSLPGTPRPSQPTSSGIQAPPGYNELQPPVPASVAQYFLPNDVSSQQAIADWERKTNFSAASFGGAMLAYRPFLLAQVSVRYQDRKTQLYTTRTTAYLVSSVDRAGIVHWDQSESRPFDTRRLSGEPLTTAFFGDLSPGLTDAKRLTALQREIIDVVYNTKKLEVPYNAALNLYGNPDGDFASFRSQLQQVARERRDADMDVLTAKYDKILDRFDDQLQKKGQKLDNNKRTLSDVKREQLFTTGEAVLGLVKGRTSFTLSRMSRTAVAKQRTQGQVNMAALDVQQLEENKADAVAEYENAVRELNERWAKIATSIEQYQITPFKKDISIDLFGIAWVPFWYAVVNGQPLLLSALGG
ncbi:MAG: hypothetical protein ABI700_21550, partial [Chloroflexota bacterium]